MASRSPSSDDETITVRPSRASSRDQLVDRDARADVDARGRLAEHEQRRLAGQAARHDDLLLVAAAERRDRRAGARRHDLQPLGPRARRARASRRWSSRPRRPSRPRTDSERFSLTANSAIDRPRAARSAGTSGMSSSLASRDVAPDSSTAPAAGCAPRDACRARSRRARTAARARPRRRGRRCRGSRPCGRRGRRRAASGRGRRAPRARPARRARRRPARGSRGRRPRRPSGSASARGSISSIGDGRDHAAAAQDGDAVGELEDLVEPVRHVEHARAGACAPRARPRTGARPRRAAAPRSARRARARRRRRASPGAPRRSRRPCARPASRPPAGGGCRGRRRSARASGRSRAPARASSTRPPKPRAKPPCRARLSMALSSSTRPRSWWTKRRPSGTTWPSSNGLAVELGVGAVVRLVVAGERLDERRLARAVLAHQGVDLARADVDRDVLERARGAERLGQARDAQRVLGAGRRTAVAVELGGSTAAVDRRALQFPSSSAGPSPGLFRVPELTSGWEDRHDRDTDCKSKFESASGDWVGRSHCAHAQIAQARPSVLDPES